MSHAIVVENLNKQYRLGLISSRTFREDLNRWWGRMRGQTGLARQIGKKRLEGELIWALRDINFQVKQGDAIGIIGRNGAGKSTLLKILSRVTAPTSGIVKMKGRLASLLEVGTGFHPELTGRENIFLNGGLLGMKKAEVSGRFDEIVAFSEIEKFMDTPVKHYSSGMYVRLAFAVAAHVEADILIVDEALSVGDTAFQRKCLSKMEDMTTGGRTILFVSHNITAVNRMCKRAMLLESGRILADGSTDEVIREYLPRIVMERTSLAIADRPDRLGNGQIRFTGLHWERCNGQKVSTLSTGEDYKLVLSFQSHPPSTWQNVLVSFAIYDPMGICYLLHQTDFTHSNFHLESSHGRFICRIPKFPLVEGEYTINIFVGIGTETSDSLADAARVIVERGDFFGTSHPGRPNLCKTLKECFWEVE